MLLFYLALLDNEDDKKRFEDIYRENYDKMLWKAESILRSGPMAEDVVHDAFMRILKNKTKYFSKNGEEISGLCVLMVKHLSYNKLRDSKRELYMDWHEEEAEIMLSKQATGPYTDVLEALMEKERAAKIHEIIDLLPEQYSTVLTMFYGFQYSCGEIASMLGISKHTVEVRLYRGRIKLGNLLKEQGYGKT
ncbi:MAG: sigma-70 family RNA polymerase sigma factor [Roseburia sp.]|nr:sigma-70 family RNA polymerase sigma factor [Roseburia sp.]